MNSEASAPRADEERPLGEALQALLCLLPAALCAWPGPGAPLAGDPWPQLSGAGLELIAALPALAVLVLRGAFPGMRLTSFLLVPLLVAVCWISFGSPSDTLEASRALFVLIAGLGLALSAASLRAFGRRILARGLVSISLLLLVPAFLDAEHGFTGVAGNSGSLSQGALAGAAAGALLLVTERGAWRVLGAAAALLFVAYVGRVPVLAGALCLALALGTAALRQRGGARRVLAGLALLALVALAHPWRAPQPEAAPAPAGTAAALRAPAPGDTGGASVRWSVLLGSLRLARANPWIGVGPGQFAARFPPYRDPREIELSTHQRRVENETEVEHPHDDWLLPFVEGGLFAGLAMLVFLGGLVLHAGKRLAQPEPLAAAAVGLCANALMHGTLSFDPLSSSLAAALAGALLSREERPLTGWTRRFLPLATLALCVLHVPRAWQLVQHGRAFADAPALELDSGSLERAVDRALEACPDSVPALSLRARCSPAAQRDPALAERLWQSLLALRPHRFEAWMQLGTLYAREGRRGEALRAFTQAAGLDPEHPGLLENFVTLEAELDETGNALAALAALQATHPRPPQWIAERGARAWLAGSEAAARALFESSGVFELPDAPGLCLARSKERTQAGDALFADCLESAAQRGWAREHAARGAWADAVRSYRQELRISARHEPGGARVVRLELAAALQLAQKSAEARAELAELHPQPAELARLPEWARGKLEPLLPAER